MISDFSDLASQAYTPFNLSWNHASSGDQYIQGDGYVSITSVGTGSPRGDGSFHAVFPGADKDSPFSVDMTGATHLQLTGRLDAGNTSTSWIVLVMDSEANTLGTAKFFSSSFTESFTTVTATFVLTGNGDLHSATYWILAGDGILGNIAAGSFDHLVAVPEPGAVSLAFAGLCGLGVFSARKRRPRVNRR